MVLELQQANPEDVQLHINSKELRIMRYLITRGLCMPRTSLSLVVNTKNKESEVLGMHNPLVMRYLIILSSLLYIYMCDLNAPPAPF